MEVHPLKNGWWQGGLFALLLVSLTLDAQGCPDYLGHRPLLSQQHISSHSQQPTLLQWQQLDLDITLHIQTQTQDLTLDQPGGRSSTEYFFLPPASSKIQACIYASFAHSVKGDWRFSQVILPPGNDLAGKLLSQAGQLWAEEHTAARVQALALYERVAAMHQDAPVLANSATHLLLLAYAHRHQLDKATARLQHAPLVELPELLHKMAELRARIALAKGDLIQAGQWTDKAIAAADKLQRRNEKAELFTLKGLIALLTGQLTEGQSYLSNAQQLAPDDFKILSYVHSNLSFAELQKSVGKPQSDRNKAMAKALQFELQAADYARQAGFYRNLANIENNIGSIHERHRGLRSALVYYTRALSRIEQRDEPELKALLLRNLGTVSLYLGDYLKARQFLYAALSIIDKAEPVEAALLHCRIGQLHEAQNMPDDATNAYQDCLTMALALSDANLEATARLGLITTDAVKQLHQIQVLANKLSNADLSTRLKMAVAKQQAANNDLQSATETLAQAQHDAAISRDATLEIEVQHLSSQILAEQGHSEAAIEAGNMAINGVEQLHQHLEAQRYGPAWSHKTNSIYNLQAQLLLKQHKTANEKASALFNLIERFKAVSLRQHLQKTPTGYPSSNADMNQASELAGYSAAQNSHAMPLDFYLLETLHSGQVLGESPQQPPELLDMAQVQAKLSPRQAILYYLVLPQRLVILTLTKTSLHMQQLALSEHQLNTLIAQARSQMVEFKQIHSSAMTALASLIPDELADQQDITELMLVPHANLHILPFAALPLKNGTRLGERFALTRIPSANTILQARPVRHDNGEMAFFADPLFSSASTAAPEQAVFRNWSERVSPLHYTATEARDIARLFTNQKATLYVGAEANRRNLFSAQVRNARVLHIATHGYFNPVNPDNMGFQLAALDQSGIPIEGFVTLPELFSYPFSNELVVINGCDTAMGKAQTGEGMVGLVHGFMAQGTKHVVSTLWPVADKASALFMQAFYQSLLTQGSLPEALKDARSHLRRHPRYRSPYYWAPYVLHSTVPDVQMRFE
ncbi:CHAT domain-containing protein [Bowmanella denitrificans]|uniref:CHAT domain-containing protein n=1 Tax=Bowmanella denitrificans TaxID=366582 RepID=A0ABN0XVL8_9ALTE